MIRRLLPGEMDALIALWLASTIDAHPFIAKSYWQESESIVRNVYIPQSRTWVYVEQEKIVGFISILDQRFIGALFVADTFSGKGIGSALIKHAQARFPELSLEVYQKNQRAVHFYHHQGFRIEESAWQEETRHPTWIMSWRADQTP
ncbi:N-acetyltransferase [Enterobacteriaceae bacterium H20N1]|uniref:N-acetyltransferase n=1 Tax=Dryocola boscaweniae TaxID=2925397 RepID=A0A9X2WBX0_9ENTR|nr:N-acetyltransferase [Dryocola boscaweniae]MCT4703304.1 N-acetyltransferase [Dryocola boscaweniae]MCT4715696.1 N-acetyltransferase [Dryocola boscaweniae]MCT4720472.1 N-acetyltransferase [Dryocola boscaweniae]